MHHHLLCIWPSLFLLTVRFPRCLSRLLSALLSLFSFRQILIRNVYFLPSSLCGSHSLLSSSDEDLVEDAVATTVLLYDVAGVPCIGKSKKNRINDLNQKFQTILGVKFCFPGYCKPIIFSISRSVHKIQVGKILV